MALGRWWRGWVRHPALALAYLAALLVLGASAGYWRAERDVRRAEASWRAAYVQSVTPYGFTAVTPAR